jgi:hypothetical protein
MFQHVCVDWLILGLHSRGKTSRWKRDPLDVSVGKLIPYICLRRLVVLMHADYGVHPIKLQSMCIDTAGLLVTPIMAPQCSLTN